MVDFDRLRRSLDLFLGDDSIPHGCCAKDLESKDYLKSQSNSEGIPRTYVTIDFINRTVNEVPVDNTNYLK